MRRVVALAVGLVLSTLLLGGGWMWSTWRERRARLVQERERLQRAADVVRGAVDESLGELREREDERSFYLYSHFYSPPDVLAIADPVAVSPLAHEPRDPRLVGYFQVDPDGAVRTPYAAGPTEEHPLARRIAERVGTEPFSELRALARGEPEGTPDAPRAPTSDDALLGLAYAGNPSNPASVSTVEQNYWGNAQAQDIYAAQAGDPVASQRVIERGRQAPRINRRDVSWESVERQQQQASSPRQQGAPGPQNAPRRQQARQVVPQQATPSQGGRVPDAPRPSRATIRAALEARGDEVRACVDDREVRIRVRLRGTDGTPIGLSVSGVEGVEARACVTSALRSLALGPFGAPSLVVEYRYGAAGTDEPVLTDETALDNLVQRETEVVYTPMAFRAVDGSWVLHRVVTQEGVSVVQGVLLDRERLVREWFPALIERHLPERVPLTVVAEGESECSLRRPASEILSGLELCFAPDALRGATQDLDAELGWQLAALIALLAVALLAAALIVMAARRAEALSRQKSAFVSAVSHELRTPLTTLRMHAEMLDEDMVSEERRPKVHRELVRESVRLARLVDNVLSLAKLEEGRRRLDVEEADLRSHVRGVVESLRGFVEERGFALDGPGRGAEVPGRFDRQAVEQIVTNLVENAVKYGGGEENAIEVRVERRDGAPTLIVRDRGPGVPEAERDKIFERFHRVEREDTAHTPGTGIGLALVADLAQAHGGAASVHEREGGGCEIRVRFS